MYTFFTTPFTILTKHALWVHFVGNLFVWAQQFALKLSDVCKKKNTHNHCIGPRYIAKRMDKFGFVNFLLIT